MGMLKILTIGHLKNPVEIVNHGIAKTCLHVKVMRRTA